MLSSPSLSATTAKAISSTMAARTLISAVVSCNLEEYAAQPHVPSRGGESREADHPNDAREQDEEKQL